MADEQKPDMAERAENEPPITTARFRPIVVRGPSASATIIAYRRGVEPIDTWNLEAKFALGMMAAEELPKLAQDALEAGNEGPAILRMAILEEPLGWETDQLLPAFFEEMGMKRIEIPVAARRYARCLARELLASGGDPMLHRSRFYELWLKSEYSKELATIGNLDDCFSWMSPDQVSTLAQSALRIVAELVTE